MYGFVIYFFKITEIDFITTNIFLICTMSQSDLNLKYIAKKKFNYLLVEILKVI